MSARGLLLFPLAGSVLLLSFLSGCDTAPDEEAPSVKAPEEEEVARTEIERGPVKVTVEVAPKHPLLSEEPVLTLTIESEKGVEVKKPPFGESLGAFIIRDFHEPLPEILDDREILRQQYTLEPTQTGENYIFPVTVTFVDNRPDGDGKEHTLETEGLTIEVKSMLETEAPSLADLKPAEGPVALPEKPASLLGWILGGAGVLAAALVLVLVSRRKKAVPLEKKLTPKELAFLEFKQLLESGLIEGDIKIFYVELTGIVRRYIERTTGIRAPEQTTEEFLWEIGGKEIFSGDEQSRLQRFLEAADLVKFAAFKPGKKEVEESFNRAKVFVGLENAGGAAA
jgi:hypothetical protein